MAAIRPERTIVKDTILSTIKKYMAALSQQGIPVSFGVLFGSQATGNTHQWSDIDLIVVSPRFDGKRRFGDSAPLWHVATTIDTRIEPIGVGERQWQEDDASIIIEMARRTGIVITPEPEAAPV